MSVETAPPIRPEQASVLPTRAGVDLFLISLLILFLELACIRWFPAHVLFLTFFTNVVLLASFLGMSVGCLAASSSRRYLHGTPIFLAVGVLAAQLIERGRDALQNVVDVAHQKSAEVVFFGAEPMRGDVASFVIPIEFVAGFFFILIALTFVGPGQELGRALNRMPNRVHAYTLNILGSLIGISLFAGLSWLQLAPLWWFLPVAVGLAYFLYPRGLPGQAWSGYAVRVAMLAAVLVAVHVAGLAFNNGSSASAQQAWSPYYRIDFNPDPDQLTINVNLLGHQKMASTESREVTYQPYALPYLLNRDAGGPPFEDVLIIGAGSGNDISRALQFGTKNIDAVEIDPVIQKLGKEHHPNRPYADPRVRPILTDGRNFLRSTDRKYDLVIYALVDSLVLHSSFSNIRLESYLFTRQAYEDARRCLKPGGLFVTYNYYRQGWLVARLDQTMKEVFHADPLVLNLPHVDVVQVGDEDLDRFTILIDGAPEGNERLTRLRAAFQQHKNYGLSIGQAPSPASPNGFLLPAHAKPGTWQRYGLSQILPPAEPIQTATDDWPFLYLKSPTLPWQPTMTGMAVMAGLALLLIWLFAPRGSGGERWNFDGRMFFLGAGFMLIETKAVVNMALLFGSTWTVNSIVFFAVLVMILLANLFVLAVKPQRLGVYYVGLCLSLAANVAVPLDAFLGMAPAIQVLGACLLVFTPILFAGVIFAVSFRRVAAPDRAFGANIAGAMLGGLAENMSMLVGFQYLLLIALGFYLLSALLGPRPQAARVRREEKVLAEAAC
jgi:spermidine synthase